jgi:hypothetical protein
MPVAFFPGTDVATMSDLIFENNNSSSSFVTDHLVMAICWEESYFTNAKQQKGSAIGFGQMEPSELDRLNGTGDISVIVDQVLKDPGASIDAMAQVLDYLIIRLGKAGGLRGYAGYWSKSDAQWRGGRQLIIDGWNACERALLNISGGNIMNVIGDPDGTIAALRMAKGFNPDAGTPSGPTWRELLFPPSEDDE